MRMKIHMSHTHTKMEEEIITININGEEQRGMSCLGIKIGNYINNGR